jgi:hypothetical protein
LIATALAEAGIPQMFETGKVRTVFAASAGPPEGPGALRVSATRHGATVKKLLLTGVLVGVGVLVAVLVGVLVGFTLGVLVGVLVGVNAGVLVAVGVGVAVGAACTSNAPTSMRLFATRGKPGPRWSYKGGGAKFGSPASMAGLPGCNPIVAVGPPLS